MARLRQLSDLRNDVRVRCDLVGSGFPADADINELVNQGWTELYDLLTESGEKYYASFATFSTVGGTSLYALPADYYETLGVDIQSGGQWFNAHRFQFERRNDYSSSPGTWVWPEPVQYQVIGGNLMFIPTPGGVYTVKHWYVPAPVRMAVDTDAIDGISGWDRYVVDWAAHQVALRDDNDELADRIASDLAMLKARIVTMSSRRIQGEAPKIRVVRGRVRPPGVSRRWWGW